MSWFKSLFRQKSRVASARQTQSFRLHLEECESRIVPSSATTSTNWSGYAVTSSADSVTSVSGEWNVPTVTGSGTAYSSTWVGIDGYSSSSVEQIGISANVTDGVANYSAWYEMYPSDPVTVKLAIHANDEISASVNYANGKFTLTIEDLSDAAGSNSFSITISDSKLQRSSAEWIEEAPSSNNGVLPLANFGSVIFSNAQATINGVTGAINDSAWASNVDSINMVSGRGSVEASTSSLNSTGTGFTVTYGSGSTVSPPTTPPTSPSPPTVPPPVTVSPPPSSPEPGTIATTTTLVGSVNPFSPIPTETLTATVSPSVPRGSEIELLDGSTVLAVGYVRDVRGTEEVTFTVLFFEAGDYTFTAEYMGSGQYESSTSSSLTVTVPNNIYDRVADQFSNVPFSKFQADPSQRSKR